MSLQIAVSYSASSSSVLLCHATSSSVCLSVSSPSPNRLILFPLSSLSCHLHACLCPSLCFPFPAALSHPASSLCVFPRHVKSASVCVSVPSNWSVAPRQVCCPNAPLPLRLSVCRNSYAASCSSWLFFQWPVTLISVTLLCRSYLKCDRLVLSKALLPFFLSVLTSLSHPV